MKRRPRKIGKLTKQQLKQVRDFFNVDLKQLRSIFGDDSSYRIFYKNKLIGKLTFIMRDEDERDEWR